MWAKIWPWPSCYKCFSTSRCGRSLIPLYKIFRKKTTWSYVITQLFVFWLNLHNVICSETHISIKSTSMEVQVFIPVGCGNKFWIAECRRYWCVHGKQEKNVTHATCAKFKYKIKIKKKVTKIKRYRLLFVYCSTEMYRWIYRNLQVYRCRVGFSHLNGTKNLHCSLPVRFCRQELDKT